MQLLRQAAPGPAGDTAVPAVLFDTCARLAGVLDGTLPLPSVAETLAAIQAGTLPPLPLPLVDALRLGPPGGGGW
ncbi:hypothetical protein SAMN05421810_104307 [Amycolatopsis arida]|uniref:Uncharacterized protein n=1 Tax=Amycolatopsis arida TaxID=587909 RepID=A0A1I5VCD3_9PSEU|nr:hypothetical protein CLV69_106306 [Amycolatopsis arida]SFQ05017.1 hypothetical protein SAMN05421810_104307 [Amycolatopsis arida]